MALRCVQPREETAVFQWAFSSLPSLSDCRKVTEVSNERLRTALSGARVFGRTLGFAEASGTGAACVGRPEH